MTSKSFDPHGPSANLWRRQFTFHIRVITNAPVTADDLEVSRHLLDNRFERLISDPETYFAWARARAELQVDQEMRSERNRRKSSD